MVNVSIFSLVTCFLLLMRLRVLHGVADGFVGKLQKVSSVTIVLRNYKRPDAVVKSHIWLASHRFPTPAGTNYFLHRNVEVCCYR